MSLLKIGILGSLQNGPADRWLANQLILHHDVPIILLQRPRARSASRKLRKLFTAGPTAAIEQWRNYRFEARRQCAFEEDLTSRFTAAGHTCAYEPGPRMIEVDDVHSHTAATLLREAGVQALLQNGAGILRSPLIDAYPDRILNVHHGRLPWIRGCHSIAWGILEDRPDWVGVTVHLIDRGIDTGRILAGEPIPVGPNDTYASLFFAATLAGGRLLVDAVADLAAGRDAAVQGSVGDPAAAGVYRPAMTRRGWLELQHRAYARQDGYVTTMGRPVYGPSSAEQGPAAPAGEPATDEPFSMIMGSSTAKRADSA